MNIINNQKQYEKLYFELSNILDDKFYRKIRNDEYNPDEYIGFLNNDNTLFIPLVSKNNLATFYGGIFYNENNNLDEKYCNYIIEYLIANNYNFRLLNINTDIYNFLNNKYKIYDVPYNNKWYIDNLKNFDLTIHGELIKNKSKQKYHRIMRSLKKENDYLEDISNNYSSKINEIIDIISENFEKKHKVFEWFRKKKLLLNILNYFQEKKTLTFYIMHKTEQNNIGWFCIINYNNKSHNILFNIINRTYENDVIILFIKMLNIINKNKDNYNYFDFMNGNFGYKDICGCDFSPVFALVKDPSWIINYNIDINKDIIIKKINRDFGCNVNSL